MSFAGKTGLGYVFLCAFAPLREIQVLHEFRHPIRAIAHAHRHGCAPREEKAFLQPTIWVSRFASMAMRFRNVAPAMGRTYGDMGANGRRGRVVLWHQSDAARTFSASAKVQRWRLPNLPDVTPAQAGAQGGHALHGTGTTGFPLSRERQRAEATAPRPRSLGPARQARDVLLGAFFPARLCLARTIMKKAAAGQTLMGPAAT